jgi:hypothetical protein
MSIFFGKAKSGDSPQVHLAKFGDIENMKVSNLKHPIMFEGNCGDFWRFLLMVFCQWSFCAVF